MLKIAAVLLSIVFHSCHGQIDLGLISAIQASRNENHKICATDEATTTKGAAGENIILWESGTVPYEIEATFLDNDKVLFNAAVAEIEANSCIRFVKKTTTHTGPYLALKRVCECDSTAEGCFNGGYTDGLGAATPRSLVMSASCFVLPANPYDITFMVHEIFHALGVIHTQNRNDRDTYVTVHTDAILDDPGAQSQYEICSGCNNHGTAYNCMSTMHYRDYFFAKNATEKRTMTAKNPATCDLQTYPSAMVVEDWQLIKAMYNCSNDQGACDGGSDDWSCCTSTNKCAAGQGDCDSNDDCQAGLVCGINNCQATNANAHEEADCCMANTCDGDGTYDWTCCSPSNQCAAGEGDCDSDADCQAGLICGVDNCQATNAAAHPSADCCTSNTCAGDDNDWSCCTSASPCAAGEGDCDSNADCQAGLVCGINNCQATNANADPNADCCMTNTCDGDGYDWNCCSAANPCSSGQGDCDSDADCSGDLVCGVDNCKDFNTDAQAEADCCK